jgi:hypothetical protein
VALPKNGAGLALERDRQGRIPLPFLPLPPPSKARGVRGKKEGGEGRGGEGEERVLGRGDLGSGRGL